MSKENEKEVQNIETKDDVKQEEQNPYELEANKLKESLEREKETRQWEREKRKELQKENERLKESTIDESKLDELLEKRLNEKLNPLVQEISSKQLDVALSSLTDDPSKKELIKDAYKNKVRASGDLEEDLLIASGIVDSMIARKYGEDTMKKSFAKKHLAQTANSNLRGFRKEKVEDELSPEGKKFLETLNGQLKRRKF